LRGEAVPAARPESQPNLVLQAADHRVAGFSGCNRLIGSYTLQGDSLRFGQMAGTRMACMSGMEIEDKFLKVLGTVAGWRISGNQLQLLDDSKAVAAEFVAPARPASSGY
jgi:heat shock protein HslJ